MHELEQSKDRAADLEQRLEDVSMIVKERDARISHLEQTIQSLRAELQKGITTQKNLEADLAKERGEVGRLEKALYSLVQYGQKVLSRDDSSPI